MIDWEIFQRSYAKAGRSLTCMRDEREMHSIENDCDSNLHHVL